MFWCNLQRKPLFLAGCSRRQSNLRCRADRARANCQLASKLAEVSPTASATGEICL